MPHPPSYTESEPTAAPLPPPTQSLAEHNSSEAYGSYAPPYYSSATTTTDDELPGYTRRSPSATAYRGAYASEEAYLAALRKWAASKQYYQPGELSHDGDNGLVGFYGRTTLEEYAARPGLGLEIRKRKAERRATVADAASTRRRGQSQAQAGELQRAASVVADDANGPRVERRKSRLMSLFSRQDE